ncbi:MAG: YHS domain-containing protein [Acidimicrobiales bacterium]
MALSILAEIVSVRRSAAPAPAESAGPSPVTAGGAPDVGGGSARAPSPAPVSTTDPVCGMSVFTEAATLSAQHEGRTVWFCGRGCRDAFVAEPASYV